MQAGRPGPESSAVAPPESPIAVPSPLEITSVTPFRREAGRWDLMLAQRVGSTGVASGESRLNVQFFNDGRTWFQSWDGPRVDVPASTTREVTLALDFLAGLTYPPSAVEWIVLGPSDTVLGRIGVNLVPPAPVRPFATPDQKMQRKGPDITFKIGDARIVFDASRGALVQYRRGRASLIDGPVGVGVWRPAAPPPARAAPREAPAAPPELQRGADAPCELLRLPVLVEVLRDKDGPKVRFRSRYLDLRQPQALLMEGEETFSVYANASLGIEGRWTWRGPGMDLRRIGFDLPLSGQLDRVVWCGPGPENNWSDQRAGAGDAVHAAMRQSPFFSGNRAGTWWMHFSSTRAEAGLSLIAREPLDWYPLALPDATLLRVGRGAGRGTADAPPDEPCRLHVAPGDELSVNLLLEAL